MNELKEAAKEGGKNMTIFGVIAIILGMLAVLLAGCAIGSGSSPEAIRPRLRTKSPATCSSKLRQSTLCCG